MKLNKKHKILLSFFLLISFLFFSNVMDSYAIYRNTMNTKVYLSILDPSSTVTVTFDSQGGSSVSPMYLTLNTSTGTLPIPTRTNYNFLGWYKSDGVTKANPSEKLLDDTTYYAHWAKIVCKKVTESNNLNTETCLGTNGCVTSGTGYSRNDLITYGTIYGNNSPKAGDAFDCDVYYDSNSDNYDQTDEYGKHIERFYFVREKENQGSENTAVLIYYTSFDSNGRVDSQHTIPDSLIGSSSYNTALGWLPTSSTWANPGLIDFDSNNGKITRFLSVEDLESICGPLNSNGTQDTDYLTSCFNKNNAPNWFVFENSRFQSSELGRAGIWLETDGVKNYRIQTSSLVVSNYTSQSSGENMARPVIEVPMSALDGYVNATRYSINFNTHDGTTISEIYKRYEGDEIGTLPTTTREHYTFDGWYSTYENGTYSNPVTASTIVYGDMTLHAKWVAKPTCTVILNLNGGSGLDSPVIVDIGELYDPGVPTKEDSSFIGWFTDSELTTPYDTTEPISESTLTLYASWSSANYVALVEGVGSYETLAEAIAAVPTTGVKTTVTILKNITLDSTITIPSTKWVEFDGGSYTISGDLATVITNSGKLDVISGTITTPSRTAASTLISNGSSATLNILGGTLTNPSNNSTTEFLTISNVSGGTVNITGGTLNTYGQSSSINNKNGILNISGGQIIAHNVTKGQAVYAESGTINISGNAYLENVSGTGNSRAAVDCNGGTINITGGTIVSNGYAAVTSRKGAVTIGEDDNNININTPVMRGKTYGLLRTGGTTKVYDGIFESLDNSHAISGTIAAQPDGIDFTDSTIDVSGVTYYSTYLLVPSLTVTFYPENGDSTTSITVDNGDTIGTQMPINPTKTNYYFDGWYDGSTLITSSTTVTSDIDAYARWVQSISSATISSTMSIVKNATNNITITGTDLEGVTYSSSDTSVATVNANGVVSGVAVGSATITITGKNSGDIRTITVNVTPEMHTVTFLNSDGETELYTREVEDGTAIGANMPSNPTDTNYVFNSWYINGNSVTPFNASTIVTGDMNVIASWKEKITYATLSISPNPLEIIIGNTGEITVSATEQNDTVEDYTFTSSNDNIATVNANGEVSAIAVGTANITITGSLSGDTRIVPVTVSVLKHTVTFKDGNDVITSIQVDDGTTIDSQMPNNPTKTNYLFDAWYVNGDSLYPVTSETIVEGDMVVVASWSPNIQLATIPESLAVMIGSTNTISITGPSGMESYTFTSSNDNIATVNASGVVTGVELGTTTVTITGDRSLTTRTIDVTVSSVPVRTVTFMDDDNTTVIDTVQVEDGNSIGASMPTSPTKQNYVFGGWYINGNSLTPFTSSTTISGGDLIVTASWKEAITIATITNPLNIMLGSVNQFNLTATGNGEVEDYTLLTSDSNIVDINNKTLYGVAVGTVTLTVTGTESNATRTITVNVINTYDVTFKDDNDNVLGTIQVANGSSIDDTAGATLPTNPTKSGYTFDDWYYFDGTDVTTTRLDTSTTVTSNMVYKPRWAGSSDVAAIGTNYYESLTRAINSVENSGTAEIRVLKNIDNPSGRTTINNSKNITINANGYTISCGDSTTNNLIYVNVGTLRVKNGTFTCNKATLATLETAVNSNLYIESGVIVTNTNNRGAIYNKGHVYISGGEISSTTGIRSVILNDGAGASVEMSGGTVTQLATSTSDRGPGAIKVEKGSVTITGGTVISNSTNSAAIDHTSTGTLVIGTNNDAYNITSPVIQGEQYGISSTTDYSIFDGIIKGKQNSQAVNDFSKITVIETDFTRMTGTDGDYYTLYYELSSPKYTISFNAINEDINPASFQIDQGDQVGTLPSVTWGAKTFSGWYTDTTYTTAASASDIPTSNVTYYAKWTYTPANQKVTYNSTNDAMNTYFTNISTWKNLSQSDFETAMSSNFSTNSCSSCGAENNCNSPTSGTYCDLPKSYDTSANEAVSVYIYDNTNHVVGKEAKYANGSSGTISNLIPGKVYYWEKDSDPSVNGLIEFTTPRRTLNVGNVRNVRDLGGLSASYTENNVQHTGTLKYGKLFRGAKLTSSQDDVTNLTNLGITREIDLRADSEGSGQLRLPVLDNGSGGSDIVISNYLINPEAVTYSYTHGGTSYTTVTEHASNASALKAALKATMRYIVDGDSIYFHCTIGTDRTGTLAYFLEGLLGVSEEDRVEDYELTYFYGLTNRTRYHDDLTSTSVYPRFKFMHTTYATNQDIYNWYVNYNQESDDLTLLSAFRQAMIE